MGTDHMRFPPRDPDEPSETEKAEPSLFWKVVGFIVLSPFLVMFFLLVIYAFKICWRLAFG